MMTKGLKTMWTAAPKSAPKFVTREELAELVQLFREEMRAFSQTFGVALKGGTAAPLGGAYTPPDDNVRRGPQPRVPGHSHRGICGKRCHDGTNERLELPGYKRAPERPSKKVSPVGGR